MHISNHSLKSQVHEKQKLHKFFAKIEEKQCEENIRIISNISIQNIHSKTHKHTQKYALITTTTNKEDEENMDFVMYF